jgi:hypothetical protein
MSHLKLAQKPFAVIVVVSEPALTQRFRLSNHVSIQPAMALNAVQPFSRRPTPAHKLGIFQMLAMQRRSVPQTADSPFQRLRQERLVAKEG